MESVAVYNVGSVSSSPMTLTANATGEPSITSDQNFVLSSATLKTWTITSQVSPLWSENITTEDALFYYIKSGTRYPLHGFYTIKEEFTVDTNLNEDVYVYSIGKLNAESRGVYNYSDGTPMSTNLKFGAAGKGGETSSLSMNPGKESGGGGAGGLIISTPEQVISPTSLGNSKESGVGFGAGGCAGEQGTSGMVHFEYETSYYYETKTHILVNPTNKIQLPFGMKDLKIIAVGGGSRGLPLADEGNISVQQYVFDEGSNNWYGGCELTANVGRGGRYYDDIGTESLVYIPDLGISQSSSSGNRIGVAPSVAFGANLLQGSVAIVPTPKPHIAVNQAEYQYGRKGTVFAGSEGAVFSKSIFVDGYHQHNNTQVQHTYDLSGETELDIIGDANIVSSGDTITMHGAIVAYPTSSGNLSDTVILDVHPIPKKTTTTLTPYDFTSQTPSITHSALFDYPHFTSGNLSLEAGTTELRVITSSAIYHFSGSLTTQANIEISFGASVQGDITVSSSDLVLESNIVTQFNIENVGFSFDEQPASWLNIRSVGIDNNGNVRVMHDNSVYDGTRYGQWVYAEWEHPASAGTNTVQLQPLDGSDGVIYIEYSHLVPLSSNGTSPISIPSNTTIYNYGNLSSFSPITVNQVSDYSHPGRSQITNVFPEIPCKVKYTTSGSADLAVTGDAPVDVELDLGGEDTIIIRNTGEGAEAINETVMHLQGGFAKSFSDNGNVSVAVVENSGVQLSPLSSGGQALPMTLSITNEQVSTVYTTYEHDQAPTFTLTDSLFTQYGDKFVIMNPGSQRVSYNIVRGSTTHFTSSLSNNNNIEVTLRVGDKLSVFNKGNVDITNIPFQQSFTKFISGSDKQYIKSFVDSPPGETQYSMYVNNKLQGVHTKSLLVPLETNSLLHIINDGKPQQISSSASIELDTHGELSIQPGNDTIKLHAPAGSETNTSVLVNTDHKTKSCWEKKKSLSYSSTQWSSITPFDRAYIEGEYVGFAKKSFGFKFQITKANTGLYDITWEYKQDDAPSVANGVIRDHSALANPEGVYIIYGMKLVIRPTSSSTNHSCSAYVLFDKDTHSVSTRDNVLTVQAPTPASRTKYLVENTNEINEVATTYLFESGNIRFDVEHLSSTSSEGEISFSINTQTSNQIIIETGGVTKTVSTRYNTNQWHPIGHSCRMQLRSSDINDYIHAPNVNFTLYSGKISETHGGAVQIVDSNNNPTLSLLGSQDDSSSLDINVSPEHIWEYFHDIRSGTTGINQNGTGIESQGFYTGDGKNIAYEITIVNTGSFVGCQYRILNDNHPMILQFNSWEQKKIYSGIIPIMDNE